MTNPRLETTYREQRPRILAWLRGRVGDDAEDVLQDVLARAFERLDALEPVRDLGAWLWRAVRNRVIDLWRYRGRRSDEDDPSELDDIVDEAWRDAYDEVEQDEILDALAEAIAALPPAQREVIVAQGLNGETFASISQRTGIPIETLATRKRSGLAKIRAALNSYEKEFSQ